MDSSLVNINLPAGDYTLAVSVFLNMSFAENLGAGTLQVIPAYEAAA